MKKDVKDLVKKSKTSRSIYGFLAEDWVKTLLHKPVKEEGVIVDNNVPEVKDVGEPDKKEEVSLFGSFYFLYNDIV